MIKKMLIGLLSAAVLFFAINTTSADSRYSSRNDRSDRNRVETRRENNHHNYRHNYPRYSPPVRYYKTPIIIYRPYYPTKPVYPHSYAPFHYGWSIRTVIR